MIADRYRLERKVGGGRVSAVWRVRDEISARPCVIKILHRSMHKHPEALTRFSLEDRLARELSGPHFPDRIGSGVWDGMRYIAWRWHEGESLRTLFERNPKQDAPTVHSVVQETCQALTLVHAAGYSHGDLKPENILFADRGDGERTRQVKLLGFGVASRLARPSAAGFGVSRRRPGEVVGTPLYLSPDLILGRVPNGGQADLWALAVIVYEALTGRPPFLGFDIGAVLHAILEKRAPRPTSVADNLPASFDSWWAQALAQEFDTPSEFAGALARALAPALRTSHTQRSASLPERLAPSLESLTPMRSTPSAARANVSTTAAGIGPVDLGLTRLPGAPSEPAEARRAPQRPSEPLRSSAEPLPATSEPSRPAADVSRAGESLRPTAEPLRPSALPLRPSAEPLRAPAELPRSSAERSPAVFPRAGGSPRAGESSHSTEPARAAVPRRSGESPAAERSHTGAAEVARSGAEALRTLAEAPRPRAAEQAAPEHGNIDHINTESFAPLPSPLRDLGSDGAKKTLVGITPPAGLFPPLGATPAAAPLVSAPAPAVSGAAVPTAAGASPTGASAAPSKAARASTPAIEGAPCRPIETGAQSLLDTLGPRRPTHPTIPFPRPRVSPRHTGVGPALGGTDETPADIGRSSWHGTTTRTLRVVLTGPDHKPQRVAAALVCAAAALVIFAIGRSPIAGTAGIGQTTGSLSADPPQPSQPSLLADPSPRSELAAASGSDSAGDLATASGPSRSREPTPLDRDELAPGLVVPPREGSGPTRSASEPNPPDAAVPGASVPGSSSATGSAPSSGSAAAAGSLLPSGATAKGTRTAAPAPAKPSLKKPTPPASLPPTPARKNSTELDFGI